MDKSRKLISGMLVNALIETNSGLGPAHTLLEILNEACEYGNIVFKRSEIQNRQANRNFPLYITPP